jgi:hypothetical protein
MGKPKRACRSVVIDLHAHRETPSILSFHAARNPLVTHLPGEVRGRIEVDGCRKTVVVHELQRIVANTGQREREGRVRSEKDLEHELAKALHADAMDWSRDTDVPRPGYAPCAFRVWMRRQLLCYEDEVIRKQHAHGISRLRVQRGLPLHSGQRSEEISSGKLERERLHRRKCCSAAHRRSRSVQARCGRSRWRGRHLATADLCAGQRAGHDESDDDFGQRPHEHLLRVIIYSTRNASTG